MGLFESVEGITEDDLLLYLRAVPESKLASAAVELMKGIVVADSELTEQRKDETDQMVLWPSPVYQVSISLA